MEGYIAEVREFAGNFAPKNWALCDGQSVDVHTHTVLYAVIGTIYGGDGIHNFKLPDLRPTDAHGTKVHGWEIGQPSKIICVSGIFPDRP